MKKLFTLAAVGAMAASSLTTQAQAPITINGQLLAPEVAANGYKLVGRMTGPRGFGDAGLLALYAAADADNVYFFIAGTLENGSGGVSNSMQLFIDRPGTTTAGVPVGTALPVPTGTSAATTSFSGMIARLDLAADMAIAIKGTGTANQVQVDGVVYTSATAATAAVLSGAPLTINGTAATVSATVATGTLAPFANTQVAYTSSANLSSNPGFASNGNAPSNGLEIRMSRAAMGLPATGGDIRIFALQNNPGGDFLSTDFIPQRNPVATNADNPSGNGVGAAVNFTTIPGTQAATVQVSANNATILANRKADAAAVALNIFPNPAQSEATVSYRVTDKSQDVRIELTDLLGRTVSTVYEGQQAVGAQTQKIATGSVAAGTYLVKVQVGEKVATRKVTVL